MEKINLSDLLEPEHMDPVKRIALIRIVDDDGGVRESYKFLIESEGWRVKTYPSAEAFLEEDDPTVPGCGVFDVRMTGITGMELHQKLIELANRLPVIFVSAHGDIEMAVNARGERFMREDRRRSMLAEAVVRQPDGMAWMVINAPGAEPLRPTTAFRETVIATISGYNDCIRTKERDSLGRDPLTMRPIGPGVEIRPVLPRILWSYGGLEINEKAEVIDRRGRPMKGLAAAGDITGGIHGEHALMGDMLASAAVFGRIAARTLVKNGRAVKRQD